MAFTMGSQVRDFYNGKNLFITGATGFVGIGLVEKLLRSCDINTLYLLMRPKKGKSVEQRLEELTKNLVFERLIEEKGVEIFSKIVPVAGDVGEENLGLSPADRNLLAQNTHVVIHSAATLDFEATLKETVAINLLGTRRVLALAKSMTNIKSMVHVSSAYVNANRFKASEEIYPPPGDVENLIQRATTLSDEALAEITSQLLGDHPNPYTITKSFAEIEVTKANADFPTVIVRPSMIVAAWKEPVEGWTISKNGPQGFIMGAAKGVVRRLPVSADLVYDYIPVDIVINELIVAGYHAGTKKLATTPVLHCTSSTCKPFSWNQVQEKMNGMLHTYPLKSAVWYPTIKLLPSLALFNISGIFVHFIPAFFLDLLLRITGGRPMLWKLHTNVSRSLGRLAPFIFNEWFFDNSNTRNLQKSLSDSDKETFNLDVTTLEWDAFFTNLVKGVRRYLNNESMKTLPAAKRKDKILFVVNLLVQILVFTGIWWFVACVSGKTMVSTFWAFPLSYALFSIL